ncbi:sepiapterin reductase [Orussus abietinus]|uniref:sepiapterin reductase n=1 Tax=Orussus abietinus TaxID=222816 RepID=UPI0006260661|nr:sepiapterin reductase [Orussus abietinus]
MAVNQLSGKTFLLVTGASQGIGRQIAQTFGSFLGNDSHVVLFARNVDGLKETASKLPSHVKSNCYSVDMSTATSEQFEGLIRESLKNAGPTPFERAVVVHNAASLGDLKRTIGLTDCEEWQKYYHLNVISAAVLNGVFMKIFNDEHKAKILVINITSLCGIQPMQTMAYYCTGKAAREMFFKVFALEHADINVLNYSPGPVRTEMFHKVWNSAEGDVKESLIGTKETMTVLTTEQTAYRLIEILKLQKYKSGDHVDYFDEL